MGGLPGPGCRLAAWALNAAMAAAQAQAREGTRTSSKQEELSTPPAPTMLARGLHFAVAG